MSKYRGFITWDTYKELEALLDSIVDCRGIKNSIDHLWSPDTDMNDKICEDFDCIKSSIVRQLMGKINEATLLVVKISELGDK